MAERRATIMKEFEFEAAHKLPNHFGKCQYLHGHSYKLQVFVHGPISEEQGKSEEGMVIDFADLKKIVKERVVDLLDHTYLNDSVPLQGKPTTAENIAWWIFYKLSDAVVGLDVVRLWETRTSMAEVTQEDFYGA